MYVFVTLFFCCCCCFQLRQQLSTSTSSDTESNKHKLSSGLLPKLAISAEAEPDEAAPCPGDLREEPEKPVLPPAECAQEEPEVTTPASTISSSTLSGKPWGGACHPHITPSSWGWPSQVVFHAATLQLLGLGG